MVQLARPRKDKEDELPVEPVEQTLSVCEDMRLVLKFTDKKQIFSIPIGVEALVAGRVTETSQPHIDLTLHLNPDSGVSRRHAAFSFRAGELYLEDLNSLNGTLINGLQIHPARLYLLRNGDEVEFGRLRLTVSVVRVPPRS